MLFLKHIYQIEQKFLIVKPFLYISKNFIDIKSKSGLVFTMAIDFLGNPMAMTRLPRKELAFMYLVVCRVMYIIGPGKFAFDR